MDGRSHERDELDETYNYPRFGADPTPVDDAYGDEARPDNQGAAPLPHRSGPAEPTPAVWGEPDADEWTPAEPVRTRPTWGDIPSGSYPESPPSGAMPTYSRLPYSSPLGGDEDPYEAPPSFGSPSTVPYEGPGYGVRPSYGQTGFGSTRFETAGGYGADTTGSLPQRHSGYGADGPATDSGGFPAIGFGAQAARLTERSLTTDREPTGDVRVGGVGELVPVRTARRTTRRGRVSDEDDEKGLGRNRRSMPLWQELPLLLVVAFCLAVLIRTFLLQAFFIPSGSMEETLLVGDRVLVNKIVYDVRSPQRGEVVVFRGTDSWAPENFDTPSTSLLGRVGRTMGDLIGVSRPGEKDFIKRVIGLPGDRVSCCDPSGRVYVNGKGIDEPYVTQNSPLDVPPDPRVCRSRRFDEVLVPPGQIFVMGDHRIISQDARCQGPVPIDDVIGRAFVIVWPSSRWDTLDVPETFADVPGPIALGPQSGAGANVRVGAAAITLPILASLVVTTRWGRKPRWGRRTLRR